MKKNRLILSAALLLATGISPVIAQSEWCHTMKKFEEAVEKDPSLKLEFESLDAWLIENQDHLMNTSEGGTFVVPVVVHVIHNYGTENISDAQIVDGINILNMDFSATNPDVTNIVPAFDPIVGVTNFEFRLAQLDPAGNCTNGITRHVSTLTYDAGDDAKIVSWPRSKYYNVWIVKNIESDDPNSVTAGYAYLPGSSPTSAVDGIILGNNYIGSIGTSTGSNFNRRVMTHETGHFFSLLHPWGWGQIGQTCGTDGVSDTPPTKGSFSTCNLAKNECGQLENVENFMDYSSCTKMFTQGQSDRMVLAINNGSGQRSSLWTASNRLATGTNDGYVPVACAPVVDFSADRISVCVGSAIAFKDLSWNATPTSWNWTITNGSTVLNSSLSNPSIVFPEAGAYSVQLTVSGPGGNGTLTRPQMVYVFNDTAVSPSFQYSDLFDANPITSGRWSLLYSLNAAGGWEQTTQASFSAPNAVMVDNYGSQAGVVHNFISPAYDFTTVPAAITMTFRYAYAKRTNGSKDQLKVYASSNCGQTWVIRGTYDADDLATVGNRAADWFPASQGEWTTATISSLASFQGKPNVRFRFEFISGGGNNFFLDDINISGPVGIGEATKQDIGLSVFPNPADENFQVNFEIGQPYMVAIDLVDMTGRTVMTIPGKKYPQGLNAVPVMLPATVTPGMYFVNIRIENKQYVEKIMIH